MTDNESERELRSFGFEVFEKLGEYQTRLYQRLQRAARVLDDHHVRYAVIGGNAVAAWVASADESAVRTTQDIDLLVDRSEFVRVAAALETAGFVHRHAAGIEMFIDGPDGRAREGIHIVFAGEKVRPDYACPAPSLGHTVRSARGLTVLALEDLVRMKLTSYRLKDQVHLQDMVQVGLIDRTWLCRVPTELQQRLAQILDNPDA